MKKIAILGATGSIGDSTLDVIARHPNRYQVIGLTGFSRLDKLLTLCEQFRPSYVCVPTDKANEFSTLLKIKNLTCEILTGEQGLIDLATLPEVDIVVASIVGSAGLASTLASAHAGKTILLANKEALVMAGELMINAVAKSGAKLLPIDSEHNAIFQCLPKAVQDERNAIHHANQGIKKLWLTASGGPFLYSSFEAMQNATIAQAVQHPNWSMGQKISIDSATMMNKGLELIEASYLFDMPVSRIDVVMHPQSVIHSMVEYNDGSFLAQLGSPDMRTPIAHALAYPDRIESGVAQMDLFSLSNLTFLPPDMDKFICLKLAYQAMQAGSFATIALNASNEVAVKAFLDGKIRLTDIGIINQAVIENVTSQNVENLETILHIDKSARQQATSTIANIHH